MPRRDSPETQDDGDLGLDMIYLNIKMDNLCIAMEFIEALQKASLDDEGVSLDEEVVCRLHSPFTELPLASIDEELQVAIKLYLGLPHADQDCETTHTTLMELTGRTQFPSLYKAKETVALLTGVEAIVHHMCINSCVGFMGPFADLENCPECGESQWDSNIF
ncbi:hypothetical protein BS17DRAFT_769891 [Gyrodon lividus]|nr:hypothetical protein BS17DRAFT_769891 [Gyrodon lividus]